MSQTESDSQPLPFDPQKQSAILGHLLTNDGFFKQARNIIKANWFTNPYDAKVYAARTLWYSQHDSIPSDLELLGSNAVTIESPTVINKMKVAIQEAKTMTQLFQLVPLQKEVTEWIQSRKFIEGSMTAQSLYNNKKFSQAYAHVESFLKEIKTSSFESNDDIKWDSFEALFERKSKEFGHALTFGLTVLDRALFPNVPAGTENTAGCLLPGDMTILLAPTNVGKTTCMITVACANIWRKQTVLFLFHEGHRDDIWLKFLCCMMNVNQGQLFEMFGTEEGRKKIGVMSAYINRYCTLVPSQKPGNTVEEVEATIRRRQEDWKEKYGKYYDLIVDDYPAKLMSSAMGGSAMQKRNVDEHIYNYFSQLALEFNSHVLCAIQTNRTGSRINKGQKGYDERLLTHEDVQESWGPMTVATNVITINRDPVTEKANCVIFFISKSRSNETGWAIACRSSYGTARTHGDDLGATSYRGNVPLGANILDVISKFNGKKYEQMVVLPASAKAQDE